MAMLSWKKLSIVALAILASGCGEKVEKNPRARKRDTSESKEVASAAPAKTESAGEAKPAAGSAAPGGWGSIKGKIVWGGAEAPVAKDLSIEKDKDHCLKAGPIKEEDLVVDAKTKGVRNVFAFLKKPSAIHPDYPKTKDEVKAADEKAFETEFKVKLADLSKALADKKVDITKIKGPRVIDQVNCRYIPHAIAMRDGQTVIALNGEPISHNINVSSVGGSNASNINMPPGTALLYPWKMENQPLALSCSIHGWMKMTAMVFDHPYYAVTGEDGSFELKNVPSGDVTLMLRANKFIDPATGASGSTGSKGKVISVKPGETVDLGEIKFTP